MPTWDPAEYLKFEEERTVPCRDLVARIPDPSPGRVIDLGCGPGTSTAILRERWPSARLVGLDSSPEMITQARRGDASIEWVLRDIRSWRASTAFDVIVSNAALQWVPDHGELFPRLLQQLAPGGVLAVQMPMNWESPSHRCIREVATSPAWTGKWRSTVRLPKVEPIERYFDLLAPIVRSLSLWQTEYLHVMPNAAAVLDWLKGTALRPYLDALPSATDRTAFLAQVGQCLERAYPARSHGEVLFPFRRLFLVARR